MGESTSTLESESIDYTVIGLNREPSGITLPFDIKLDNAQSITAVSSGWVVSILLFLVVRMLMKSRSRLKLESKLREDFWKKKRKRRLSPNLVKERLDFLIHQELSAHHVHQFLEYLVAQSHHSDSIVLLVGRR